MIGWIEGIQNAIEYIEDNLTEELNISEIAERACISACSKRFSAMGRMPL